MSNPIIPIVVVSIFWAAFGIILPFFAKGQNKQVIQVSLILTAICCWLFWICVYAHQLNPLIGPELKAEEMKAVLIEWAGKHE